MGKRALKRFACALFGEGQGWLANHFEVQLVFFLNDLLLFLRLLTRF
jgi:hypothetical protein